MDTDVKKVIDKQKADRKKQELKRLFKKIDSESKGFISAEVFFRLLTMEGILLGLPAQARLLKECRPKAGGVSTTDQIQFRDALKRICINLDVDEPLFKEWVVRDAARDSELSYFATSFGGRFIDKSERSTLSLLNHKHKTPTRDPRGE